jgi:hypothetical protein
VIVVSTGRVLSTRTVSLRSLRLPAASTAAVSSWWAPVPLTLAELPVVQLGLPAMRHSVCTGEPPSASAVSGTVTGPLRQLAVGGVVVLAGTMESIETK